MKAELDALSRAFAEGRRADAQALFAEAHDRHKADPDGLLALAAIVEAAGLGDLALRTALAARSLAFERTDLHMRVGDLCRAQGRLVEADDAYRAALVRGGDGAAARAITEIATIPQMLSVHPSIPVKSLKELIALAKARPGELNFGTAGTGSTSHMAMELFQSVAKIKMTHVPYKGTGPAMIELIGGHLSLMFDVIMTSLPHVQSGKLRTLALSSLQRSSITPQVPTIAESGFPAVEFVTWWGMSAPANTPRPIADRLNTALVRILQSSELESSFSSQGVDPLGMGVDEFNAFVRSEAVRWQKVLGRGNVGR